MIIRTEYISALDEHCSEDFVDALEQLREAVHQHQHGTFGPNRQSDVNIAARRLVDLYESEFLT